MYFRKYRNRVVRGGGCGFVGFSVWREVGGVFFVGSGMKRASFEVGWELGVA